MKRTTLKLTRKVQLLIDLPTEEEKKEALTKLYQWQNRAFRAANLMVSHLYVQDMIKDFLYLSEGVKYKLVPEKKDELGILQYSRVHTTYRVVSNRFKGEIPTNILSNLKKTLFDSFNRNSLEYWKGERSLPNFRRDMALPFDNELISEFSFNPEKRAFCFSLNKIPFRTYLGKDYTEKKKLLQQVITGDTKLCASHLKLKNGKIFWLPVFEFEREKHSLKPELIAEASLSLKYPIVVKVSKKSLNIGTKEEFLHRRLAIQASLKRAQQASTYSKGGKGRKRKTKAVENFYELERNYVNHRLHLYSRLLIDFCIKNQAGTLILLNQENKIKIAKDEEFVLRNWSYNELMTKIQYKAEKAGIEIIVD